MKGREFMSMVEYQCRFNALICRRDAYRAENRQRELTGNSLAYGADHFLELGEMFKALAQDFKEGMEVKK